MGQGGQRRPQAWASSGIVVDVPLLVILFAIVGLGMVVLYSAVVRRHGSARCARGCGSA